MKILVICTGNTCRSQMAEGFLKSFDERLTVFSAGTSAEERVNPFAVRVMAEVGIDIGSQHPDPVMHYLHEDFDFVVTVCDDAKEVCPVFTGNVGKRLHIGFEDPAKVRGTQEEVLSVYRKVRDQIKENFYDFYLNTIKKNE
jgi:arsenate reductase